MAASQMMRPPIRVRVKVRIKVRVRVRVRVDGCHIQVAVAQTDLCVGGVHLDGFTGAVFTKWHRNLQGSG